MITAKEWELIIRDERTVFDACAVKVIRAIQINVIEEATRVCKGLPPEDIEQAMRELIDDAERLWAMNEELKKYSLPANGKGLKP